MDNVHVSVADILEVRDEDGFYTEELLALIVSACDALNRRGDRKGVFSPDYIFVTASGNVEIALVEATHVDEQFLPPEIRAYYAETDNVEDEVGDPQLVWCLGEIVRQAAASCSDASLFSLINLMTVEHVGTRPTIQKLAQMAKNKIHDTDSVRKLLMVLYQEIMGDLDDLAADEDIGLSDEMRLSRRASAAKVRRSLMMRQQQGIPGLISAVDTETTDLPKVNGATTKLARPTSSNHSDATLTESSDEEVFPAQDQPDNARKPELYPIEEGSPYEIHKVATRRRSSSGSSTVCRSASLSVVSERPEDLDDDLASTPMGSSKKTSVASEQPWEAKTLEETPIGSKKTSVSSSRKSSNPFEDEDTTHTKTSVTSARFSAKNPSEEVRPEVKRQVSNPFDEEDHVSNPFDDDEVTQNGSKLSSLDLDEREKTPTPPRERTPPPTSDLFPLMAPKSTAKATPKTPPRSRTPPKYLELQKERSFEARNELEETPKHAPFDEITLEEIPTPKTSVSARHRYEPQPQVSQPQTSKKSSPAPPPPPVVQQQKIESTTLPRMSRAPDEQSNFSRQNSLQPSKVRRSTLRKPRKTIAIPEFVERRSSSLIRLQAQSAKKKRTMLPYRVEITCVYIKVLNGQTIEVNCKTDAYVSNIFDSVVAHLNITEHTFFGLAIYRDEEYFFLENDQRLEKFAPPGWKSAKRSAPTAKSEYTLHLRFRYYPKRLEFIKTELVTHELYLQMRLDILASVLKPNRDKTFELGALALQAEYSDRRENNAQYFQVDNYLPKRAYSTDDIPRVQGILSELHTHYSGMRTVEAERTFIQICQNESDYGTHYYRVYKIKPSSHSRVDLNFADSHSIGIMPNGLMLCKDQHGNRVTTSAYEWGHIRTLQFDRKRFLIVTGDETQLNDHIFYTDHYSKSGYLVRFAASQHRFMIKMRHWQSTLPRDMGRPDIGMDKSMTHETSEHSSLQQEIFETIDRTRREKARQDSIQTENEAPSRLSRQQTTSESEHKGLRWTESGISEAIRLNVQLEKDPIYGLGLTLVDGVVNGVKGVYVKSVSNQGDGRRKGLIIGDCLQSVNGVSLVDKTRHDAVNLVKESGPVVSLEILRFPLISEVLGTNEITNGSDSVKKSVPVIVHQTDSLADRKGSTSTNEDFAHNQKHGRASTPPPIRSARTPPPSRKPQANTMKTYKRAVSDFGAIGDTLPVLNSEDLLGTISKSRSNLDSSDESDSEAKRGEYNVPVSSMYHFHASEDEDDKLDFDEPEEESNVKHPIEHYRRKDQVMISGNGKVSKVAMDTSMQRRQLDWTTELSDIDDGRSESDHSGSIPIDSSTTHTVFITKIPGRSLGFQIASSSGNVYVKAINAEPALSANLKVDDRIISVNQRSTSGCTHAEVVDMLRAGTNTVVLTIERPMDFGESEETITVALDKSMDTSLGLSLAKKMGHEGIFIRNISSGSVADNEGTLKVGDRVWAINNENVADESPSQIVERLKLIQGRFTIVVKRATRRD